MTDDRPLDPWDRALLDALDQPFVDDDRPGDPLTLDELAERTGISPVLLEMLAREGFLVARSQDPEPRYDPADADAVAAGFELVEAGLPLAELLDLARRTDEAMRPIAAQAVEVFARFVRDSVEATASSEEEAARRLVEAFRRMLPATGRLVGHHFRTLLVAEAHRRLAGEER